MSEFSVEFSEDFLSELLDTDFGEIAEEALEEAAPILEREMKKACKSVIEHDGDSELVDSIKASKPLKSSKTGAWIVFVEPAGYSKTKMFIAKNRRGVKTKRKYKVSNALKAIWKEYGIPGNQAPRPFITAAVNRSRSEALKHIQEVYNRKVGKK